MLRNVKLLLNMNLDYPSSRFKSSCPMSCRIHSDDSNLRATFCMIASVMFKSEDFSKQGKGYSSRRGYGEHIQRNGAVKILLSLPKVSNIMMSFNRTHPFRWPG